MPCHYSPHDNSTSVVPDHMNDLNREEPSRYVSECQTVCECSVVCVYSRNKVSGGKVFPTVIGYFPCPKRCVWQWVFHYQEVAVCVF